MKRSHNAWIALSIGALLSLAAGQQQQPGHGLGYVRKYRDPVGGEIEAKNRQAEQARAAQTAEIRKVQAQEADEAKNEESELRFAFADVEKPASPDEFQAAFHFPPLQQFSTGNCWSFSATSFFESEIHRLSGRKLKLSEMFTVYYEYVEKARRFVQQRGASFFDSGSEGNVVMQVWSRYGIVPADAYRGTVDPDGRYLDAPLLVEMKAYLDHVKQHELWDEELVVNSLRLILDKYMGQPPERFTYAGAELTPQQFLTDIVRLRFDEYVCIMSTLAVPFHEYGEYKVPANWWHSADYYNVPLDEFYGVIQRAAGKGYTVKLNGDVSEPGLSGKDGLAIIPSFDIPREHIDQAARELRIFNKTTDDDHDVHLVGTTRVGDSDWFLIKDSMAAAHWGPFKGYMFYRADYVKLKMLTYIVHGDIVRDVVKGFEPRSAQTARGRAAAPTTSQAVTARAVAATQPPGGALLWRVDTGG